MLVSLAHEKQKVESLTRGSHELWDGTQHQPISSQ